MKTTEIIRASGDLKREVWRFSLSISLSSSCIYLDSYSFQDRETRRAKWRPQNFWVRIMQRDNTIKDPPPIPLDVEAEMRHTYQEYIAGLPIGGWE